MKFVTIIFTILTISSTVLAYDKNYVYSETKQKRGVIEKELNNNQDDLVYFADENENEKLLYESPAINEEQKKDYPEYESLKKTKEESPTVADHHNHPSSPTPYSSFSYASPSTDGLYKRDASNFYEKDKIGRPTIKHENRYINNVVVEQHEPVYKRYDKSDDPGTFNNNNPSTHSYSGDTLDPVENKHEKKLSYPGHDDVAKDIEYQF